MLSKKMLIGGQWIDSKRHYELRSPYNGQVIARIPLADRGDIEKALASAEQGAKAMRLLTSHERSAILEKVAQLFQERAEQCAAILANEAAKPLKAARAEIARTIETYKFAAEEAKRIHGETIPLDAAKSGAGRFGYTKREPLGVIAAITPFNFPFNLVAHKLGPAFAAGNAVVLKPASQTPLSALMTAQLFAEAGLPAGALNVVTGSGSEIGDVLVQDARVKMITFTGSAEVGRRIKEQAGLKRVTLELGSNSAVIIDSAEDLEAVAARCAEGAFSFAGQVCISVQRIFVQERLFESFVELLTERAKRLVYGDPHEDTTDISALIHTREAERIERWVAEAADAGARIACGGRREGGYYEPTVIVSRERNLTISCQEAFGPVVVVDHYHDWDEAISAVNDSAYGLQAGVYTTSISKAFDAVERLEVGGVIINDIPTFRVDHMPYGGVKNSGLGKEGIKYSIEEMSELKFVSFKL
ncbi:aldehyde dehydrogenase family protein [Paenibacillus sp. GCM10027626]|uniref:aldehyde dehydrogenase family protein n=1 Tax=Paenibacillus sp. GCM10027626 TaxID=3273411 RepID=UPI00363FAE97